ncbi:MAG: hypothetical protein GTO02_01480, partial [Candidatus Dadabacteria bacterium]|nr:hypothetical protein [Candidatus Dadabacteria bacterium]
MKNSIIFSIFFCSVLIFSLYSIPHNFGQSAFGHEHPSHAKCWDEGGFNQPYNFLDTTEFFLVLFLTILAYALWWFFGVGAAIYASIPGVNAVFYALKVISPAAGVPLAAYNCPPEIVPPPVTVAGKVNLECNAEGGFEFERIENTFVDAPNTLAPTSTEVLFDDGSPYPLPETLGYWESDIVFGGESFIPVVYVLSGTPVWVFIGIIFIITIIVDGIFLWADSSGKTGKDFSQKGLAKKVKKEGGKDALKKVGDFFKKLFKKSSKEAAKETSETGAKKGPSLLKKIGTKIKDAPAKAIEEQKKFCKKCIKQGQKAIIKGLEADPV